VDRAASPARLLRGSFVPGREIRELRDLNRHRVAVIGEWNRVANRVQKILEDANVKLTAVASDALGLNGRSILGSVTFKGHVSASSVLSLGCPTQEEALLAVAHTILVIA
jgi:hypothetical protein